MRNASGHQCKVKMSGSEKKREREHVGHFLHKTCNQEVSGSFTRGTLGGIQYRNTVRKIAKYRNTVLKMNEIPIPHL